MKKISTSKKSISQVIHKKSDTDMQRRNNYRKINKMEENLVKIEKLQCKTQFFCNIKVILKKFNNKKIFFNTVKNQREKENVHYDQIMSSHVSSQKVYFHLQDILFFVKIPHRYHSY